MNFLAFRQQIYDWTLDTDENVRYALLCKLFNQVNQLTQYIFQTEKNINQSIAITRTSLNESSTILNNNFNHYLRLSENKFTENVKITVKQKIAQPKKSVDQDVKKQQTITEPKPKMEIYKEALNISLKNLEIKQEEKQIDNISLSELSLSQAIFKNARLPPYFGSKQFRAQKFLNLFFDEDFGSEILSKKEIESLSNKPLSRPSQMPGASVNTNNINVANGYLPPPPSLQTLNLNNNGYSGGMNPSLPPPPTLNLPPPPTLNLPPPPTLNLPPPPTLNLPPPPSLTIPPPPPLGLPPAPSISSNRQSMIQIDENDENKELYQSILVSKISRNDESTNNARDSFLSLPQQPEPIIQEPQKPVENRPMTFQEELALKLKLGKDYKPPTNVITKKSEPIPQIIKQPEVSQPVVERSTSFRQSTKIDDIIGSVSGVGQNKKPLVKQTSKPIFEDDEEEEESALFGSGKKKTNHQISTQPIQSPKIATKNEADIMMSRSTFNEDMLFKKKPIFSKESVLPTKAQQKTVEKSEKRPNRASAIFNQDSDEDDNFTFKKKVTKKTQQSKPQQAVQQKQTNPLINTSKQSKDEEVTLKKVEPQQKKKTVNKLFGGDSQGQDDMFSKKKLISKKAVKTEEKPIQSSTKITQKPDVKKSKVEPQIQKKNPLGAKKNSLFDDDQQDDFSFKPKLKNTKKESKNEKQQKKSSLFNDDEDEGFSFKPKTKTSTKQKTQPQPIQQTVQQIKKIEPLIKQAQTVTKKQKNPLFGTTQEDEDINFGKKTQKVEKVVKTQENQPKQKVIEKTKQPEKVQQIDDDKSTKTKTENIQDHTEVTLQVRRKKNKPKRNLEDIFDEEDKIMKKPKIISHIENKSDQVQQQTIEQKEKKVNPLFASSNESKDGKQSQISKIAKMSIAGMTGMSQMGLGPLIPKGLIITKPSEAKKMQQQALEKLKKVELDQTIRQKQEEQEKQRLREIQQQQEQKRIAQEMHQQQARRIVQEQSKRVEQENSLKKQQQQQREAEKRRIEKEKEMQKQRQRQRQKQRQIQLERQRQQQIQKEIQRQRLRQISQKERLKAIEEQQIQRKIIEQERIRRILEQEEKRRKIAEQEERIRIILEQEEKRKRLIAEQEEKRRKIAEQEQRIRRIAEQEEKKRNEERIRLEAQKTKKANLPSIPNFNLGGKTQSNQGAQKSKNSNPLEVPKMPPKSNPLGGLSKSPLGGSISGPLGGNLQKSTGPLSSNSLTSAPSIPSIKSPTQLKNPSKKSLFDDDQEESYQNKKPAMSKPSMPTINQKKKGSLFNDDEEDFGFGKKSKPKAAGKKKGLFDDDEDQGLGFGKKPQKKINEPVSLPVQEPVRKIPEPLKIQQEVKPTLPQNPVQKSSNAKKLFGGSDSEEDSGFGKKKVEISKQSSNIQPATNNFAQNQPKSNLNNQKEPANKRGLFAGSSDEDSKPIKTTKNVPVKEKKQAKKGLFGGSSDSQDDVFKKKKAKNQQAPKPMSVPQSSPLIPTQRDQTASTSPLIPNKKSQSLSANPLPNKSGNPLLTSSTNPISSSSSLKIQPLTQNTPSQPKANPIQQKKRNIFEESQEESESSPIIATKQKTFEKPAKKGIISQDSQQEEKPSIKPVPVKQPEPQPQTKANNNRKLFDDSEQDSEDEEMMRKKRMVNSKLKKLF